MMGGVKLYESLQVWKNQQGVSSFVFSPSLSFPPFLFLARAPLSVFSIIFSQGKCVLRCVHLLIPLSEYTHLATHLALTAV